MNFRSRHLRVESIALYASLILAPLMLGSVHSLWAIVFFYAGLIGLAAVTFFGCREKIHVSFPALGLLLLAVVSAIQSIPLPSFFHIILSPEGRAVYQEGLALAGAEATLRPLSMLPAQTLDRSLRWLALFIFALLASSVRTRSVWRMALWVMIAAGALNIIVGASIRATDPSTYFGLYTPSLSFRSPTTFINTNHGAVFLGLASLSAFTLVIDRVRKNPTVAILASVAGLIFLLVMATHDSDGTLLAFLIVSAAMFIISFARRPIAKVLERTRLAHILRIVTGTGALILLLFFLDVFRVLFAALRQTDLGIWLARDGLGRLELVRAGLQTSLDYWRFGSGAGAVEGVVDPYVNWSILVPGSIPVLENDFAEILMTYGWPIGLLAMLLLTSAIFISFEKARDRWSEARRLGALAIAVYTLVVAQFHFPFVPLGIGIGIVVLWELSNTRVRDDEENEQEGTHRWWARGHVQVGRGRVAEFVVAAGILGSVLSVALLLSPDGIDDLDDAITTQDSAAISSIITRSPGESRIYVALASAHAEDGKDDQALALAEFALKRRPSPLLRLYAARVASRVGNDQAARDHYATFFDGTYDRRYGPVLSSLASDVRDPDALIALVVDAPETWAPLYQQLQNLEDPLAVTDTLLGIFAKRPDHPLIWDLLVRWYLKLGEVELASMWAQNFLSQAQKDDDRALALTLYLEVERASNDPQRLRSAFDRVMEEKIRDVRVLNISRSLRQPEDLERLAKAWDLLCRPPVGQRVKDCWLLEAYLAEQDRRFRDADAALERVDRRFDDPHPYAAYLLRRGACARLENLAGERRESRHHERLRQLASDCRKRFETQ